MESKIQKEWGTDILLNFGTRHSKGTAVLFGRKFEVINFHKSEDSRILLVNLKIEDETLTLVNIYAPNNVNERKLFFSKTQKWVEKFAIDEQKVIIGGILIL